MTLEILKSEALKLGKSELFDFAQFIIEALKEKDKEPDFHLTEQAIQEIERRSASIKNGSAKTTSWDAVEESLKKRYEL